MLMSISAGALAFNPSRGLGHRFRVAPDELHRMGRQTVAFGADRRLLVAVEKTPGRDHLRKHQRGAETARYPAHGEVADARHRRQHDRSRQAQEARSVSEDGRPNYQQISSCLQCSHCIGERKQL